MSEEYITPNLKGLKILDRKSFYKYNTPRLLRSSVILPSQYASYAVCVEFVKEWFLSKFPHHYFNSIYIDGTHSFDEFRKFSDVDQALKRANPITAIIPTIDMTYNRQWVDSIAEFPMLLRRSRMEGTFFHDIRDNRGLHLQLMFKSILMTFQIKIRVDTRAEELDMVEYLKLKHRAGFTETQDLVVDILVPKQIISQIAFDNGFRLSADGRPVNSLQMLEYLNKHSLIPFLYKLRCATGNPEYFIKVPNCVAHIKTEMPTYDDGERQNMISTNYNIDFNIEVEMTAPYCYTYYSQKEQNYISTSGPAKNEAVCIMMAIKTEVPSEDENHWKMITDEPVQYQVDEEDVGKAIDIDFKEFFSGMDILKIINYTLQMSISPSIFMNFIIFNDGIEMKYDMDWLNMIMHIQEPIINQTCVIGIYCDNGYINNTILHLTDQEHNSSRVH